MHPVTIAILTAWTQTSFTRPGVPGFLAACWLLTDLFSEDNTVLMTANRLNNDAQVYASHAVPLSVICCIHSIAILQV